MTVTKAGKKTLPVGTRTPAKKTPKKTPPLKPTLAPVAVADVKKAAALMQKLIARGDTNADGSISSSERGRLVAALSDAKNADPTAGSAIDAMLGFAKAIKKDTTISILKAAVDEISKRVAAADTDGSGKISSAEYDKLSTRVERTFADFARKDGKKSIDAFDLPQAGGPGKPQPKFDPTGTPKQVLWSLVFSVNRTSNDNHWPQWAVGQGKGTTSRWVLDTDEAKPMVAQLAKLPAAQAKAVLEQLSAKIVPGGFGCMYLTPAAVPAVAAFAKKLGLGHLGLVGPTAAPAVPPS